MEVPKDIEHRVFFDEKGKAIGIGSVKQIEEEVKIRGKKYRAVHEITASGGASSEDYMVVSSELAQRIADPKDSLELGDITK